MEKSGASPPNCPAHQRWERKRTHRALLGIKSTVPRPLRDIVDAFWRDVAAGARPPVSDEAFAALVRRVAALASVLRHARGNDVARLRRAFREGRRAQVTGEDLALALAAVRGARSGRISEHVRSSLVNAPAPAPTRSAQVPPVSDDPREEPEAPIAHQTDAPVRRSPRPPLSEVPGSGTYRQKKWEHQQDLNERRRARKRPGDSASTEGGGHGT